MGLFLTRCVKIVPVLTSTLRGRHALETRAHGKMNGVVCEPGRVGALWPRPSGLVALAVVMFSLSFGTLAHAQESDASGDAASGDEGPTAEERQAAADAYDRGTRAYLAEDYARAAQWFETAHRMAPASAALVQAVRSYERAGETRRAATLALRLESLYPGDADAQRQAERTLAAASTLARIDVRCDGCTLELDGALMEHPSFFVDPGTSHELRATFDTGAVTQRFEGGAGGASQAIEIVAPPPTEDPEPVVEGPVTDEPAQAGGGGGIHPAFAITGVVLTAIAGGVLIWSGLDALDGVPAYEADPTPERLADGQSRELRTDALIGVTAGLGAITVVLLVFTDWDGDAPSASSPDEGVAVESAALVPVQDGAAFVLAGSF